MDASFNLQSRPSTASYIPPQRTQLHPRMQSFSSPFPTNPRPHPPSSSSLHPHTKSLILLTFLFTVPFLFYLLSTAHKVHLSSKFSQPRSNFYGLLISVGPTGCQIRVFEFLGEGRIPFLDGTGSNSMKVRPGLVGFVTEPENAGRSIEQLIKFAGKRVPSKEWGNTKVQLMAGVELESLGPELREKVLESCRRVLRSSGFLFKDEWARVLQGGILFCYFRVTELLNHP